MGWSARTTWCTAFVAIVLLVTAVVLLGLPCAATSLQAAPPAQILATSPVANAAPPSHSPPRVHCESTADLTAFCIYERALCAVDGGGFVVLSQDARLDGTPVAAYESLNEPPFHAAWTSEDFDGGGPAIWRRNAFPYRSFIQGSRTYRHASAFLARHGDTVEWVSGVSAVLAFDAANYNIYHWVNTVFAAFLARLRYLERIGNNDVDLKPALERLYAGVGYDSVFALRGPPTDWQQNYADIALGANGKHTRYHYRPSIASAGKVVCFERAVIPGAALYLGNGIANAQLIREIAHRLKGVPARGAVAPSTFCVTWFFRRDKRTVTNLEEAAAATRQVLALFEARAGGASIGLDLVHWEDTDSFQVQALQMSKTRVFITTHGSALNHCMFMPTAGVVIEIDAFQFRYSLDEMIVLQQGHHFMRYSADLSDTQHSGREFGADPYSGWSAGKCNRDGDCVTARRDANVRLKIAEWSKIVALAVDAVIM